MTFFLVHVLRFTFLYYLRSACYLFLHGSTRPNKKDHLLRSRDFVASTTVASRTLGSLHAFYTIHNFVGFITLQWTAIPSIPRRPPTPKLPTATDFPRGALFDALESWARLLWRKLLTINRRSIQDEKHACIYSLRNTCKSLLKSRKLEYAQSSDICFAQIKTFVILQ